MKLSINQQAKESILSKLSPANQAFNQIYKGDRSDRQPIHTVYQGAHHFNRNAIKDFKVKGYTTYMAYAYDIGKFGRAFQLKNYESLPTDKNRALLLEDELKALSPEELKQHPHGFTYLIQQKVLNRLQHESVEDYRIDFEDGFGSKSNEEEDRIAIYVGKELAEAMKLKQLPYYIGLRVKAFTEELNERSIRTIDLVLTELLSHSNGKLPENFVIMLPKVTIPEQVDALTDLLSIFEEQHNLPNNAIKMEMMVETTQAVMAADGTNPLYRFIKASKDRCHAMHFGTYDYTASCGITAAYQEMDHPVCDFAHHMTKVALAHTGIWLSDGATNTIPIGPHTEINNIEEYEENLKVVHAAWLKGYKNIRHSLWNGFYQGWDLYAEQLPMRYAAVYAFFLESYPSAVKRMKAYLDNVFSSTTTDDGGIAEDAATGQALLNFFLKAENCGAISMEEIMVTGLTKAEIESRSFARILKGRMK